jgi:hypothetical protein
MKPSLHPVGRMHRLGRWRPWAVLAVAALAACGDSRDPTSLLTTSETAPALNVQANLPTLPSLVSEALGTATSAQRTRLLNALAEWAAADVTAGGPATVAGPEAAAIRQDAREHAAPVLADLLGAERVDAQRSRLRELVSLGLGAAPADDSQLRTVLGSAAVELQRAAERRSQDDMSGALAATMAAADALQRMTPSAIASDLVDRARSALVRGAAQDDGAATRDEETTSRATRLLRGAQEALGAGDYQLAIRRAFYALELLRPN